MRRSSKVAAVFTGGANNDGISNWVHLYYPNDDHAAECFHGKGNHAAAGTIASFCPGNNIGSLRGTAQNANASFSFSASEGRHPISSFEQYGGYFTLTGISIRGWTGDAKCT